MVRMRRLLPVAGLLLVLVACGPSASGPGSSSAGTGAALTPAPPSSGSSNAPQPAPPSGGAARQVLQYGYNPILAGAAMYIAQDRGYFAEQGLDVQFVPFDSGALAIAPVSAGQIDVAAAVLSPSFFNALARDVDLKVVATLSLLGENTLLVRKSLWDSGEVQVATDLRGRRVSFNVEGSPADYVLRNMLLKFGITLQDVEVQRVSNSDLAAALANGAVDAGTASDPLPLQMETRGIAVRLLSSRTLIERQTSSILVAGPSMLARGADTNTRFLVGFLKGVRDWVAASRDEHVTDPELLELLSKWTRVAPEIITQVVAPQAEPEGRLDLADMNRQQDFWVQDGLVPVRANLERFVEHQYLDAALAQPR
jgi:NitT/TauT family transport system substrate-binding protein